MRVIFLGTGTSHGIPVIGCDCQVCKSSDPRDRRSRASILLEKGRVKILVDATPELRIQLLSAGIGHVDAMLLTHAHADHIAGLDDVRVFSERENREFPIYGAATCLRQVKQRYDYVFRKTQKGGGKPRLLLQSVVRKFKIKGIEITPISLWHGRVRAYGYRIDDFAYLTDVSKIPPASYRFLKGLSVLVLDALRTKPHNTHFHLEQALLEAKKINAKRTYLTHMCHKIKHAETERQLPPRVQLAYDGLKLKL